MRRAFFLAQCAAVITAVASLLIVMFVLGDTDIASSSLVPGRVMTWAIIGGSAAVVAGAIQWIGLPPESPKDDGKAEVDQEPANTGKAE